MCVCVGQLLVILQRDTHLPGTRCCSPLFKHTRLHHVCSACRLLVYDCMSQPQHVVVYKQYVHREGFLGSLRRLIESLRRLTQKKHYNAALVPC